MIKPSKLNRRIVLLKPQDDYDSIYGKSDSYEEVRTVWAEFLRPNFVGKEAFGNEAAVMVTQGIRLRPVPIEKHWHVRDLTHNCEYEVQDVDRTRKGEIILTTWEVEM